MAGTASGVLLGALIPPVATPGATASILAGMDPRRVIITLFFISAGAGLATLTASLASVAADGRPHRWPAARTAWLTADCLRLQRRRAMADSRLYHRPVLAAVGDGHPPADPWHWLVAPYLATVLLLTAKDWLQGGRVPAPARPGATGRADTWGWRARDAAVLVITPACAAVVGATLFLVRVHLPAVTPYATVVRITEERWWTCALTGWAVLVILALAGGVPRLARACLSAWLAAVLAGRRSSRTAPRRLWHFRARIVRDHDVERAAVLPRRAHHLPGIAARPPARSGQASVARAGRSQRCRGRSSDRRPRHRPHRHVRLAAARESDCAAPDTDRGPRHVRPAAARRSGSVARQVRIPPPTGPAPPHAKSGSARPQRGADTDAVSSRAHRGRGRSVPRISVGAGQLSFTRPALVTYQPAGCAALAHEDYLNVLPRPIVRAEDRYKAAPALPDDGLETLSVRVESFPQPVPASLLTAASQIFRACPSYTTQTSGSQVAGSNGLSYVTTHAASEPGLGFPAWRADISMDLEPGSASVTWIMITAGHNFMLISQQTISPGSESQPDEKVLAAAVTATVDALARTLTSLDPGPRTGS